MDRPDDCNDSAADDAADCENSLWHVVRLPAGDRSLARTMQQGRDLMLAELADVDLTEADFYWAMFHHAILERAVLSRCDLRGAVFQEANLRHADLSGANCGLDNLGGSTDFIKADLSGANLRNADLGGANFTGALLVGADLSGARAVSPLPDRPARFQGADLTEARLSAAPSSPARSMTSARSSRMASSRRMPAWWRAAANRALPTSRGANRESPGGLCSERRDRQRRAGRHG
jgi:uncharacterized protein YjbI with pentapeptide repeats